MSCAQLDTPSSRRPFGQRLILEPVGQRALPERPVDDHRDAALRRQRQQPRLRLAVDDVVGELHEIDRLVPHDLFDEIMTAAFGRGDADVTHRARRLHLEQHLQMRLPGEQIVNLNEIELRHTPEAARLLDLGGPPAPEDVQTFSAENSAEGRPSF